MWVGKASRIVKVLLATLREFSCLSLPLSSSSSSSKYEVILTVTSSKKPIGKNFSNVTGTSGSYSSRSISWISCLLMFLGLFFPCKWQRLFFLPYLFLQHRNDGWIWFCFLSLHQVTGVHPSSSSSTLLETSIRRVVSIKGPYDAIGTTTRFKLLTWIVINFSRWEKINSVFTLPWGQVCFCCQGDEEHS